ncbi:MAG: hypothetical protein ACE5GX_13515 [Thermoanaerobaculia bacterium]
MAEPDYLICLNCESPCYNFEWADGKLAEVLCLACGNEEPDEFATEDDLEVIMSDGQNGH